MTSKPDPSRISESNKLRLTRYLIDRVTVGISGRDREDLVDMPPLRALFAGVLRPVRESEVAAAERGTSTGDAPVGTALGLDFRVRPASSAGTIKLTIIPRWSLYYVVFPTWEQALGSNKDLFEGGGAQRDPSSKPQLGDPSPAAGLTVSAGELNESTGGVDEDAAPMSADDRDAIDESEDNEDQESASRMGRVVLPRVFRRYDVCPGSFAIEIPAGRPQAKELGRPELSDALERGRVAMGADPDAWRHLGLPSERQRELGDKTVLRSRQTYASALAQVKGEYVALPQWSVGLQVDSGPDPASPDMLRVRVLLVNETPDRDESVPDPGVQERALFDAGVAVKIDSGDLVPFDFLLAPKDYRNKPQMPAKGINCTVLWDPQAPGHLNTESLPLFSQSLYRTNDPLEVRFESLDADDWSGVLDKIAHEMDAYLARWDSFLATEARTRFGLEEIAACKLDRDEFAKEIERYRLGVEALSRDPKLLDAFRLMNQTFARRARKPGERMQAWRLFQLGFIVSQLPSLAVRELSPGSNDDYSQAVRSALDEVGVLWFPTGGGKTEAYLGLLATALLYDRLRGKTRGVSVWMRFPLRMLSLQQLERLARVIAELNELREDEPRVRTGEPFAIGYFVGDAVTPNRLSEDDMRRYEQRKDLRERARQLRNCPFCGSRVEIEPRRATWRLVHVCTNKQCFSNTSRNFYPYSKSLPLLVVDNEIYRYLPSVLVGTVDKLAIVGLNRAFVQIVRGANSRCPVHGYTSYDECWEHWVGCKSKKRDLIKLDPIKDPGISLLVQDELHLLRAELGVFNGHYEGLLRFLGEKAYLPPKVLAATATIEAYDIHAFHIYLSRARRFPQPGWEQGESFYATSKPLEHRRHYLGILCHSRAIEDPALRVLALYWREVRRLQADLRKAASVMGQPDATDDAIRGVLRLYDLSLAYVNRKATGGSLQENLSRVNRALAQDNLGSVESCLLTGDQTSDVIGETLDRIGREGAETGARRLDVVIATSLISHGVDIERINMMLVCGMPSHYAEYVQSTSRAARSYPGIVFVCFKARDPRETSQYEFFPAMHENIDRLIEAVPVNRFASFAPDKTVPGLLAGVLMCSLTPELYGSKITKPLDHVPTLQVALGFKPAAKSGTQANCIDKVKLQEIIERIIGVDIVRPPASPSQIENVRRRVREVLAEKLGDIGRTQEPYLRDALKPIISFRDVDEGISFISVDSAALVDKLSVR